MAHEKKCPVCKNTYWGNLNKHFCSDACRKYASRNPEKLHPSGEDSENPAILGTTQSPQLSAKGRTNSTNLINYAGKKLIDVVAHNFMNGKTVPSPKKESYSAPLQSNNLQQIEIISRIINTDSGLLLPEDFREFIGDLRSPFKMLVWGMPGQGKSTFCLKLSNALVANGKLIYVSAEENPTGPTYLSKVKRTIDPKSLADIMVLNRLPNSMEWKNLLLPLVNAHIPDYKHVLYDSSSVLDINPDYPTTIAKEIEYPLFETAVNHIFISHAQKDGKTYIGPSTLGHDVDIVIKVDNGEAIIEKNRYAAESFGLIGATLKIF